MGSEDYFKIEIGYLRRTPILKTDTVTDFKHIGTKETFKTKTPVKEELFANKWSTLCYRKTPRDLFDTYQITKTKFNQQIFHKCAIIESLTHKTPKTTEIKTRFIEQIPIDTSLRNLLQKENLAKYDFTEMARTVKQFTEAQLASITIDEVKAIEQFYNLKVFDPTLIDNTGLFHEKISEYPAVLRTLQQI